MNRLKINNQIWDDLLRLIQTYKIDSIYLDDKLINSFNDYLYNNVKIDSLNMLSLSTISISGSQLGIYSIKDGLRVFLVNKIEVLFLNRVNIDILNYKSNNNLIYLVVGQNWNIRWQEMLDLHQNVFVNMIVTSKFEPGINSQDNEQQKIKKQIISDLIVDLQSVQVFKF